MTKMGTEKESKSRELKHLDFMKVAAIKAFVCISNLYLYAKQNSGPLKSTVGRVENAVSTVVTPVYEKFKDVPDVLLIFLDKKVDEAMKMFDKHAPPFAKQVVSQAHCVMLSASEKAQKLLNEFQLGGPRAAVNYATSESKIIVLDNSVKVWVKLNKYPIIHTFTHLAVPTVAHWSEKYNRGVKQMIQKGYRMFGYVPLVPIDEISKAFKQSEAGKKENAKKEDAAAHKKGSHLSDSD